MAFAVASGVAVTTAVMAAPVAAGPVTAASPPPIPSLARLAANIGHRNAAAHTEHHNRHLRVNGTLAALIRCEGGDIVASTANPVAPSTSAMTRQENGQIVADTDGVGVRSVEQNGSMLRERGGYTCRSRRQKRFM